MFKVVSSSVSRSAIQVWCLLVIKIIIRLGSTTFFIMIDFLPGVLNACVPLTLRTCVDDSWFWWSLIVPMHMEIEWPALRGKNDSTLTLPTFARNFVKLNRNISHNAFSILDILNCSQAYFNIPAALTSTLTVQHRIFSTFWSTSGMTHEFFFMWEGRDVSRSYSLKCHEFSKFVS